MSGSKATKLFGGFVVWLALAVLAPAFAAAASVSGTVTAEGGGPIQGVEVCAWPRPEASETTCADTDSAGHYLLADLAGWDYLIRFSGWRNNLRYVDEFYENARYPEDENTVHLEPLQNMTIDAALGEGGSISGTVADEVGGAPIANLTACAIDHEGIPLRCSRSTTAGEYVLNGLPSDTYSVEYEGQNRVNYLREFYEDASGWGTATDVVVTAPATTAGIDAELAKGAEILGHVSDVETGGPLYSVFVCAEEPEPAENQGCDWTDLAGDYAIRGLKGGSYRVGFGIEYMPFGKTAGQWWEGAASAEEADPITIVPPESRTGIDGAVPWWFGSRPPGSETTSPPIQEGRPSPLPPVAVHKPRPRKCKKGFHRKLVKGKRRCVRKHPRHPRRHHRR